MWLVDLGLIIVPFLLLVLSISQILILLWWSYCSYIVLPCFLLLLHCSFICVYLQLYLNSYELIFSVVYYPGTSNFSRNAAQFSANCFIFIHVLVLAILHFALLSYNQTNSWMHGLAFLFLSIPWLINCIIDDFILILATSVSIWIIINNLISLLDYELIIL